MDEYLDRIREKQNAHDLDDDALTLQIRKMASLRGVTVVSMCMALLWWDQLWFDKERIKHEDHT